nr:hypothetical protein [Acholeplasmatales bacterium]
TNDVVSLNFQILIINALYIKTNFETFNILFSKKIKDSLYRLSKLNIKSMSKNPVLLKSYLILSNIFEIKDKTNLNPEKTNESEKTDEIDKEANIETNDYIMFQATKEQPQVITEKDYPNVIGDIDFSEEKINGLIGLSSNLMAGRYYKYWKRLDSGDYENVSDGISLVLGSSEADFEILYLLFLSLNKNFIDFKYKNIKNIDVFNEAKEKANEIDSLFMNVEYSLYLNLADADGFSEVLRHYQLKNYEACLKKLQMITNDYQIKINCKKVSSLIKVIFSKFSDYKELNLQVLILNALYLKTNDDYFKTLLQYKIDLLRGKQSKINDFKICYYSSNLKSYMTDDLVLKGETININYNYVSNSDGIFDVYQGKDKTKKISSGGMHNVELKDKDIKQPQDEAMGISLVLVLLSSTILLAPIALIIAIYTANKHKENYEIYLTYIIILVILSILSIVFIFMAIFFYVLVS